MCLDNGVHFIDKRLISFNTNNESFEDKTKEYHWFPINKGGPYRKYYGNQEYIIDLYQNGRNIKKSVKNYRLRDSKYYFKFGFTWSRITSSKISFRIQPSNILFGDAGPLIIANKDDIYLLGFLNSKVANYLLQFINPTLNFQVNDIESLPIKVDINKDIINRLLTTLVEIAKTDWNHFETSWEYKKHPFLEYKRGQNLLLNIFEQWENYAEYQISEFKNKEEEINRFFINTYNLQSELTPELTEHEITLRKANKVRDTKSFLSYYIGCLIGRYSLDKEGLVFAGGEWDESNYLTFLPNKYGLIQLTDEQYFEDDIISRLREFLELAFDTDTVDENVQWLAESLELKRNESAEERLRRYFLDEFFKDHCQVYQKRPIYWLVDSGKQKGLRTLIYMHRYQPDTMATIRFEHLQEIQAKYHYEISDVNARIVNPNLSATEKRDLEKRKTDFQKRLDELLEFDKKLAEYANAQISIDLDDGVNVNYQKFEKVLANIK